MGSKTKTLKDKAWKLFSKYIRLKWANRQGIVRCVSCDRRFHWKDVDAGHFFHRNNSTYFDETNVFPQCRHCNRFKHGNRGKFQRFMDDYYGRDYVDKLERRSKKIKKWKVGELEKLIRETKSKVEELEKEKG